MSAALTTSGAMAERRTADPRLPRASSAVAAVVAIALSLFPSYLPHSPIVQGVVTALFVLLAVGLVRRLHRTRRLSGRAHHAVLLACGAGLIGTVLWADRTQDTMRTDIGMAPLDAADWAGTVATASALVLLLRGVRGVWRRRRLLGKPLVAVGLAASVLMPASPVHGASTGDADGQLLSSAASPVGAVRSYADMVDGEGVRARAERAADQLVRGGGLQRDRVVIMIPTGSGWVDPNAVTGLENRFGRDVAMVGMQYADTPSWWAYLTDQDGAARGARALFDAVARRVDTVPADRRPQLHVYGESLGATAGQDIFTGPGGQDAARRVCSVLWVGTPGGERAGLPREASVANDDDPVVHAAPSTLFRSPDDGRPWLPVVSLVQTGVDYLGSLAVPTGAGHRYGPEQADALPIC
ncbi:alpha/beta-hydrolase family protein [Luteipulveratus halotolerans]|uniref:alpha/beta-hydrolase family protein n=1 Tax=Luteipulveratus halotolerans TaxID=1631356 RepID=UPI00067F99E7|nr:alpha/beta-hydrolase family protein [Luteipulveratus halotolerans]